MSIEAMLPSRAVKIIHRLYQNNPGKLNILVCISYSVNSNAHTTPVRIYGEPHPHKFCAVNIFLEYHSSSSKSPVAKFDHVLGRDFMIQRVLLIRIYYCT